MVGEKVTYARKRTKHLFPLEPSESCPLAFSDLLPDISKSGPLTPPYACVLWILPAVLHSTNWMPAPCLLQPASYSLHTGSLPKKINSPEVPIELILRHYMVYQIMLFHK